MTATACRVLSPVRYWVTVLSVALFGTALGDATAIEMSLGFAWPVVLFEVLILVPLRLWRAGVNATLAFWTAYVPTRPLGAAVADWLGKPPSVGGLGWGDGVVTGLGLALFATLVTYLVLRPSDVGGAHPADLIRQDTR